MRRWHLTVILTAGALGAAWLATGRPLPPRPPAPPTPLATPASVPEVAPVAPPLRALPPDPPARTFTACGGAIEVDDPALLVKCGRG